MTYPIPNYTRVWVRGRIIDLGKAALQEDNYGLALPVTFSPSPKVLLNAGTGQIISTASFKITPAAQDGYFAIQLPATDDPDINPTNFTYAVKEPTGRSYNIVVPAATPLLNSPGDPLHGQPVLDLITIVPSPPAGAGSVQLLTGLPGRGIASTDNVAGDLVITYTDSTTQNLGPVAGGASKLADLTDVTATGAAVGGLLAVAAVSGAAVTRWEVIPTTEITPADIGAQPTDSDLTAIAALAPTNDDFMQRKAGAWANRTVAQVKTDLGVAGWKSPLVGRYFLPISQGSGATGNLTNNWLRVLPWIVRGTVTIDRIVGDIATAGEVGSKFRMGIYADNGASHPGALVVDAGQIAADSATVQELTITPVTLQPGVYWLGGAVQLAPTTQPSVRVVNGATPDVPMILGTSLPAAGAAGTAYAATGVTDVLPPTFPVNPAAVSTGPRLFLRAA